MIGLAIVYVYIAIMFVACVVWAARSEGKSIFSKDFWC